MKTDEQEHQEQVDAESLSSPSGVVIYKAVLKEGFDELARPSSALFWSGLAAGLSMGGSLVAEGLLASYLPQAPWRPLIAKLGYSLGFLVVILGRQQLFTENTLTPILPLLQEKTLTRFAGVMRLWVVVLAANLVGCLAVAWACTSDAGFDANIRREFLDIGQQAMAGGFAAHLIRAVFAGWLIALMVWLLPFAESARLWVIVILSYVIGLGHFGHLIAGGVQTFYIALTGEISWGAVFGNYFVPTFIGNVIGGVALVAAINHAQVVSGAKNKKPVFQPGEYSRATT
ncbi:MAG TPA: formate/nitrite transporter family protein [Verrucomicrobiae bacterium]|nr:formate/nitrite transporter family protein [Verrucomicrobiae bacterium]